MLRSARATSVVLTTALLLVLWAGLARPAEAQGCDITDPFCETTTTTEPVTTTTTESTTTTTAVVTTTTAAPRTATSAPASTTTATVADTTTTTATTAPLPLLADGPPPVTGPDGSVSTTVDTEPVADEGGDDGRTARQVTLVVTSLLVLAVVFGLLTYWYWRRTAPRSTRSVASSS